MPVGMYFGELLDKERMILERMVPSGSWLAPNSVELDKKKKGLYWGAIPREGKKWMEFRTPKEGMLEEFVQLANSSPEKILRYAKRWGVLMRCPHGLPFALDTQGIEVSELCQRCWAKFSKWLVVDPEERVSFEPIPVREPIDLWRRYAREAQSILGLATDLHRDRLGSTEDWGVLLKQYDSDHHLAKRRKALPTSLIAQRADLAKIIQRWPNQGKVRILFKWNADQEPEITYGGGFLGALAIQIMLAVSRAHSFVICSACGTPFAPKRKPNPNRRRYCNQCGKQAAWRDAKRVERQK